jgi:hypothetical protein
MEIVNGGFVVAVLSAAEGVDFDSYSRRYYSGEAVSTDGNHSVRLGSDLDIASNAPPPPPRVIYLTAATGEGLPAQQREYLNARLPLALRAFRQRCPILPDEVFVDASLGALLETWCGLPPGTMTYVRKTNLGTVAFAIAGMKVDLKTGVTSYHKPVRKADAALATLAQLDTGTELVIDSALTAAQFVGFAFPPYGLILAGGAAIIQMIFGKLMSGGSKVSLAQSISDAVEKTVVDIDLQKDHAKIITVYEWFTTNYNAAYVGEGIKKTDDEYRDFKTNLNNLLGPFEFRTLINTLKEPAFSEKGFTLFLLGTSLLLLLEKVRLLIDSSDKKVVDTTAYGDLMSTLISSIDHANTVAPKNKKTIDTELGKITEVTRYIGFCGSAGAGGGGCAPNGYRWIDETGRAYNHDDTWEQCHTSKVEHRDEAEQQRAKYYPTAQKRLYAKYGDPGKVSKIIAAWTQAAKDYEKYKPQGA